MIHELQSHADDTAAAAAVTAAVNDESTKWLICIAGVGGRSVSWKKRRRGQVRTTDADSPVCGDLNDRISIAMCADGGHRRPRRHTLVPPGNRRPCPACSDICPLPAEYLPFPGHLFPRKTSVAN